MKICCRCLSFTFFFFQFFSCSIQWSIFCWFCDFVHSCFGTINILQYLIDLCMELTINLDSLRCLNLNRSIWIKKISIGWSIFGSIEQFIGVESIIRSCLSLSHSFSFFYLSLFLPQRQFFFHCLFKLYRLHCLYSSDRQKLLVLVSQLNKNKLYKSNYYAQVAKKNHKHSTSKVTRSTSSMRKATVPTYREKNSVEILTTTMKLVAKSRPWRNGIGKKIRITMKFSMFDRKGMFQSASNFDVTKVHDNEIDQATVAGWSFFRSSSTSSLSPCQVAELVHQNKQIKSNESFKWRRRTQTKQKTINDIRFTSCICLKHWIFKHWRIPA